jgi:hypothetical protein
MADQSQEEAAAAEPAGDGRPSPRRPHRHRPQAIRSALLRNSSVLGVACQREVHFTPLNLSQSSSYNPLVYFGSTYNLKL